MRYNIIRYYCRGSRERIIKRNVSLEVAQAHCADSETSSATARTKKRKAYTKRVGAWFDGYKAVWQEDEYER